MTAEIQWVVLELSAKAEGEDPDTIAASIRHHLRDAEVFIPASVVQRGAVREVKYLVDGYAFVKHRHPDASYLRLEDTKYVQTPLYLTTGNRRERKLATVTGRQIQTMKAQVTVEVDQGIEIGDSVQVISGPYKNIQAIVREEIREQDSVVVHIRLRSTDRLVTLPRAFLRLEAKAPSLATRERLQRLGAWLGSAARVVPWSASGLQGLISDVARFRRLEDWANRLQETAPGLSPGPELRQPVPGLNLVVDGTQLYIRCVEAPGLSSLVDEQGRRTGGIIGFLRSLGAYHKRFSRGTIYICWDGSSERRKAMFPGYKDRRGSRSAGISFGLAWLREVLPMLGVHQAVNPQEEADDVMAALVRGPLRGSTNVLVTSDRDLLQVVDDFTHQLCPAVGGGKERLYGPESVTAEYGVAPAGLVQLRALSGDSSDCIPGVPGFGAKTAAKVLRPYGTVAALLESDFAGLSKAQALKLRACACQVLLNVELMALQDVPFNEIRPDVDQEAARTRLKALGVRPDSVLSAFFGPRGPDEASDVSL